MEYRSNHWTGGAIDRGMGNSFEIPQSNSTIIPGGGFLGADFAQAADEGLHEGIKDSVKYLFIGSMVFIAGSILFNEPHLKRLRKRVLHG